MGSFNEMCALSELPITPGTPIRQIFLTQNPYVDSDQQFARRGCYSCDQWFVRTPPVKGKYDDYGDFTFQESPTTALIAACFSKDVVEMPYGFNQYHTGPVKRGENYNYYLGAASQGRLAVSDAEALGLVKEQESPNWTEVQTMLRSAGLPIQSEVEGGVGYNAQQVVAKLVVVTFNTYGDNAPKLLEAKKVLSKTFDCKIRYKKHNMGNGVIQKADPCLLVTVQGGFGNPNLLYNIPDMRKTLRQHPEYASYKRVRTLPVLSVLIREDVWQAYCNLENSELKIPSVDDLYKKIQSALSIPHDFVDLGDLGKRDLGNHAFIPAMRDIVHNIPFQTTLEEHITEFWNGTYTDEQKETFARDCAELSRIHYVLGHLHHSWFIPSTGGQSEYWQTQTDLLKSLAKIAGKEHRKDKRERARWDL